MIWLWMACIGRFPCLVIPPPVDTGTPYHPDSGDCDAQSWFEDLDGDGWGDQEHVACAPEDGWVDQGGDCDDADPTVHPGQIEWPCDGVDNDCAASTPEATEPSSVLEGQVTAASLSGDYALSDGEVLVLCGGETWTASLTLDAGSATLLGHGSTLMGPGTLITVTQGDLTLSDVSLYGAETGLYAVDSAVVLRDVTVRDHTDGGVVIEGGSLDAQDLVLWGNQGTVGAGLSTLNADMALSRVRALLNVATVAGGGVSLRGGTATGPLCQGCAFVDNEVTGVGLDPGSGGGLELVGVGGTLEQCEWSGNTADHGGGVYVYGATVRLEGGSLEGGAADQGAGLYLDGAAVTLDGVNLVGNTATSQGGSVFLTNSTLSASDTEWRDNAPDDVYSNGPWTADGATTVDCGVTSLCE